MKSLEILSVLLLLLAVSAAATTPAPDDGKSANFLILWIDVTDDPADEATEDPNWRENWTRALASGDRDTVARAINPLIQLLTEAQDRDKRLRRAVEQLTDAFDVPIVLGQNTELNWEQLILNVTNQEKAIEVLTPVEEAINWMRYNRKDRGLTCKAMINWRDAEKDLKEHLKSMKLTRDGLYFVKALEAQTQGSPAAAARLAANYYKQSNGGITLVDSNDRKSRVLQHAVTMMRQFVDNVSEIPLTTTTTPASG